VAIVRLLLEKGVNLETPDAEGLTPLAHAILENNEHLVKLLLEKGVNLETQDADGRTPLHHAVRRNNEAIVRLLLEKGAKIDVLRGIGAKSDLQGRIHDAIVKGNENVVRLLLVMGVDIEERHIWFRKTPLLWACHFGQSAIAKLLLEEGADMKACDEQGGTVLHWAVYDGNASLLTFLLDTGALEVIDNVPRNEGNTPLHWAGRYDERLPLAQILVERGARLDIKNNNGQTPYEYAISEGEFKVAEYLWSQLEPNEQAQLTPPPNRGAQTAVFELDI
jgi:ankyrin repeat protein